MTRLDDQSRSRLLFVVERYGADDVAEVAMRTRALAATMASRGHSVTVLTTCAKDPRDKRNDLAPGRAVLDGVSVIRFVIDENESIPVIERVAAERLRTRSKAAAKLWARNAGPAVEGYRRYLVHLGHLYDAVLFTGAWTRLVVDGLPLVRKGVLCPPPMEDPSFGLGHAEELLRKTKAVALTTSKHRERLFSATNYLWRSHTEFVRACPSPVPEDTPRSRRARYVTGPYLLHVGIDTAVSADLADAFRFFRDAHGTTRFEDDTGQVFHGRDLRLVFVGDARHVHDPANGIISLGRMDDVSLRVVLRQALAVVHHDRKQHLPTFLLDAWSEGKPALLHGVPHDLETLLDTHAKPYVYDGAATFAASAASLLSRGGPRQALGKRMTEIVRRPFQPAKVAVAIEHMVRVLAGKNL